jgi:rod shape-determining protein MreD
VNPYAATITLAALALLQTTLMPAASLGFTRPLLPLLAVVTWGLHRGPVAGAWWALAGGLFLDIVSPAPLGTYTLPMLAAAGVVALVRARLYPTSLLLPIAVAAAATAAFTLVQRGLLSIRLGYLSWAPDTLAEELLPAIALNLLWLPLLYFPLRSLARASQERIEWET